MKGGDSKAVARRPGAGSKRRRVPCGAASRPTWGRVAPCRATMRVTTAVVALPMSSSFASGPRASDLPPPPPSSQESIVRLGQQGRSISRHVDPAQAKLCFSLQCVGHNWCTTRVGGRGGHLSVPAMRLTVSRSTLARSLRDICAKAGVSADGLGRARMSWSMAGVLRSSRLRNCKVT